MVPRLASGDGPGHSGLTGAGAGGHRERSPAENTPSRFQSTQPTILVLLPEQDLLAPLLADIGPDDAGPSRRAGRLRHQYPWCCPLDASAVWVMVSSWSGSGHPDARRREFVVATFLVRCRTQVVPVSGVAMGRAAGDVVPGARTAPTAQAGLERAAGNTVALRRVAGPWRRHRRRRRLDRLRGSRRSWRMLLSSMTEDSRSRWEPWSSSTA